MIDLGTLGGSYARATSINDSGQVVGYANTGVYGVEHAFLITPQYDIGGNLVWNRDIDGDGADDLMTDLGVLKLRHSKQCPRDQ